LTLAPDIDVIPGLAMPIAMAETYAFNFTQAVFWRKFGYLAAIRTRVGFYAICMRCMCISNAAML
jgi:hypothetical protein